MSNLQGLMQENRARILQFVLESFPFERTAFTIADFDGLPVIEQNLIWLLALTPFLDQPTETLRLLNGLGMETTPPFAKAIRFFLKEIVFEIRANLDRPLAKTPSEKNDSKNEFLARLAGVLADFEASMQSFERLPQARTGTDSINRIDSFIQSINTRPYKALHERIFFRIGQSCLVLPGLVLLSHFLFGTTPLRGGMALYLIAGGAAMALSPWLNHALTGMNNKGLVQAIQQGKALIFFDQKDLYDQVKEVFSALTIYHRQIQEMISQDPSLSLATDKIETLFSHSTVWALKCIRCLGPMKKNQIEEIAKVLEESKQEGQNLKNRIAALGDHLKSLRQRRGDLI